MKKEKLKLVKREITEKDLGFRMRLEPNDYLALRGYAEKHDVKMSDVVLSALRQCGVTPAPRTARDRTGEQTMTIIPKGETHGWAFAKFGEEDGDRLVVSEDLVVIPKKDYDKVQGILAEMRKGPPPGDQTPASMACSMFADRIDKALSGNGAGENKKGKTMLEYKKYIRCHIVEATPMTRGDYNSYRGWEMPSKEQAADEGYHVVYPDGYESWCPKAQFEDAGRPVDGMTFGMAIEAMKRGKKVARRGWNGKGMWLCIPLVDGPKEIPATGIWGKPNAEYAEQNGGTVKVVPYVTMKAADGTIVMGWLASQIDMISEDWTIVE